MKLNQLSPNKGSHKVRRRLGRGVGSGKGKTAGRGMKGQKSRSGVALKGFEGGQMPIHMRLPKRGFNVPNPIKLNAVNLGRLQIAIDDGKLDKSKPVSVETLIAAGVIRRKLDGVRILAKGELKEKLDFDVAGVSAAAQAAIEKLGGAIKVTKPKKEYESRKKEKPAKGKAKPAPAEAEESAPAAEAEPTPETPPTKEA